MIARFEELDWQPTPMGELTLRRRIEPTLGVEVFEVKLGEEFLMSSLFTVAEKELAHLGLAATEGDELAVLVGGLGLGYTALAALADPRVTALTVVDALPTVIDWHQRGLLPTSSALTGDARTRLQVDDFFALMRAEPTPDSPRYDAILVDIDHSPRHQLDPSHADLYTVSGLQALARHLQVGGIFALWSDDPPDDDFMASLGSVFVTSTAHVISFDNRITGGTSTNTVYVTTT
ncbi:spermidine synthase [Cryobacterium sp. Hz7]|uniref:spermidine synthase n=1 Tax=Cryobacterium sp. Hz7 TaxID=1259166 RepID=UPI00106B982B|nr:spermidine synthase [Cryobacterium sp. Hz7]TFB63076.1 spermidine synthase [Cryobacterium sp. Hz7]